MRVGLTDFSPQAAPFMLIDIPLSSIGRLKRRLIEPTAVRGTTAGLIGAGKSMIANIPGEMPRTAAGVTGVGVGVGLPVGDGVGVGVGVAVGVGVGDAEGLAVGKIGNPLAPVRIFPITVDSVVTGG